MSVNSSVLIIETSHRVVCMDKDCFMDLLGQEMRSDRLEPGRTRADEKPGHLCVAHHPFDRVPLDIPIAAEGLDRLDGYRRGGLGGAQQGGTDHVVLSCSTVNLACGAADELPCSVHADECLREDRPHCGEVSDAPAELDPLQHMGASLVQRAGSDAHAKRRDSQPMVGGRASQAGASRRALAQETCRAYQGVVELNRSQ